MPGGGNPCSPSPLSTVKNEVPKEWYWLACLAMFMFEREAVMDVCYAIIAIILQLTH